MDGMRIKALTRYGRPRETRRGCSKTIPGQCQVFRTSRPNLPQIANVETGNRFRHADSAKKGFKVKPTAPRGIATRLSRALAITVAGLFGPGSGPIVPANAQSF